MAYSTLSQTTHASNRPGVEWKAAQNICLFPFQYGSCLDKGLARQNALYALSELFQFAASSEPSPQLHRASALFCRAPERRLAQRLSLVDIKYIRTQLKSHAQGLAATVSTLENRHSLNWPRASRSSKAEKAANLLLTDFKYLPQRAETLAKEWEHVMDTLANSYVLEESRRSTEKEMRVHI